MESPRKFNDCYFYYYSTCTKGDNCAFRHEPSALGCEMMCSAWQQGKCLDKHCKLRHMELRKNRKQIPCYWENQPGGCRKKHCPFMHKNPDARTDGILPSQPVAGIPAMPPQPLQHAGEPGEGLVGVPPPVPAPVPMLWQHQQQRQVVLDSAILGVLPSSELRRVLPAHGAHAHGAHAHGPHPAHGPHAHETANYGAMPVDPLVVNFEEESDNESVPSSTPTKNASPDDDQRLARSKSQELLLLEKIQAEAAAFYSYESVPEERKIRTNLSTKYDRLSLDEISGKKQQDAAERRSSLDFKILSLDEIRARKKTETIIHSTPIQLNLNRKRKLSTQEGVTTSGNKIIKMVRSNSIVYKKLDQPLAASNQIKTNKQAPESNESRKRTYSEQSEVYEIEEDELVDNCFEFKRIKVTEHTFKPRLIRNRNVNATSTEAKDVSDIISNVTDNDSDTEVQIVGEIQDTNIDIYESGVIDLETNKLGEPVAIIDLSDDDIDEITLSSSNVDLGSSINVPDVVASCQIAKVTDNIEKELLKHIDSVSDSDINEVQDSLLDDDDL